MKMKAKVGEKAPNFDVSEWVQGKPTNIDQENGRVVLVEVFQVNCPGCFLYAIPEVISIFDKFKNSGLSVIGIATAFEDFDKNTLKNLQLLLSTGELIGETKKALAGKRQLQRDNKLNYTIPFTVGMDQLTHHNANPTHRQVVQKAKELAPDFDTHPESIKNDIIRPHSGR